MFALAGAVLVLAMVHPLSRATLARLAPFAFAAALTTAQAEWQKQFMSKMTTRMMGTVWHSFGYKLTHVPYMVLPATDTAVLGSMALLCVAAVASFFWLRGRERKADAPTTDAEGSLARAQRWALRYRWELFAAGGFVAYFAFPLSLNSATLIYQRWFPPAFAVLAVVAAPKDLASAAARIPRLVVLVLPVATLLVAWPAFADSSRSYRALEDLQARVEPGSATAVLNLGPGDESRTFSLRNAGGRILATRGGRLGYAFTDSPISPVLIPAAYRWDESLVRIAPDAWAFEPAQDLRSYRYVLVRTSDRRVAELAQFALRPEAHFVAAAGEWVLFESTLTVIPAASPELPLPSPPPDSLKERLTSLMRDPAR
jgi:hypothetical protein